MNSAHRLASSPLRLADSQPIQVAEFGTADRSSADQPLAHQASTNQPPADPPLVDQHPLEVVQQIAQYFSVLGEPMRLRILDLLRDGEKCVQDLVGAMNTSQANVSKHLKVMLQAGILDRRTEGTSAYYRVADELIFDLCGLVCDRIAERIELQAQQFREFSLASRQSA